VDEGALGRASRDDKVVNREDDSDDEDVGMASVGERGAGVREENRITGVLELRHYESNSCQYLYEIEREKGWTYL
jgi:hypothetical protein